jgi:hypothetical protein
MKARGKGKWLLRRNYFVLFALCCVRTVWGQCDLRRMGTGERGYLVVFSILVLQPLQLGVDDALDAFIRVKAQYHV